MKRDAENEEYFLLDSGKEYCANEGIIGLGPDFRLIHGGYDDTDSVQEDDHSYFTPSDAVEIADYMISEWSKFRDHWRAKL